MRTAALSAAFLSSMLVLSAGAFAQNLSENAGPVAQEKTKDIFSWLTDIFSPPSQESFESFNQTGAEPTNVNENENNFFGQMRAFFSRLFGGG